jgi:protein SCO1/2
MKTIFNSTASKQLNCLSAHDTELYIANLIDAVKFGKEGQAFLLDLLKENNPAYQERSSNVVTRLRGYALAAMYHIGLPLGALPYICAILETERTAYLVAAAARALRAAAPIKKVVPLFLKSIDNIRLHDDAITFAEYQPNWPLLQNTTALNELLLTIQHYGSAAAELQEGLLFLVNKRSSDFNKEILQLLNNTINIISVPGKIQQDCCDEKEEDLDYRPALFFNRKKELAKVIVQDQDANDQPLTGLLNDKLTVLTFFYTRCENPFKCSMTISRLANLSNDLADSPLKDQVNVIGITYDSSYDLPNQLKVYGARRGMQFSDTAKLLRVQDGYEALKTMLHLGVSYIGSVVNIHRNELYILDSEGEVLHAFTHERWDVAQVKEKLEQYANRKTNLNRADRLLVRPVKNISKTFYSVIMPLLVALFPKCPLCWAAYLSSFGLSGLSFIPYSPWLYPIILTVVAFNFYVLFKRAYRRKYYLPCMLSAGGMLLIMLVGGLFKMHLALYTGVVFVLAGSLLNSYPVRLSANALTKKSLQLSWK